MAITNNVLYLKEFLAAKLPVEEYVIVNSIWLAIMGIRPNGDLDLLLSSQAWRKFFPEKQTNMSFGVPGPFEKRIRVHSLTSGPYTLYELGLKDNDDAVYNHRVIIENIPIIEPRFYFRYKVARMSAMHSQIASLPIWKRNKMFSGKMKKCFLKKDKDERDFVLIKQYFAAQKNYKGILASISAEQWGEDDPRLAFLFPLGEKND